VRFRRADDADGGCSGRALRADAARNRDAILAAARQAFAAQGLEASLEEIAARAGVGIGTLYRRFPSRSSLIAAALDEPLAEYAKAADQALASPDPWTGFSDFVLRACELQAGDRGLSELLTMTLPEEHEIEQIRRQADERIGSLIERAKAAGKLRPDFTQTDLALLLMAAAGVMKIFGADAPDAWRRFLGLAVNGVQHDSGADLPGPPTRRQLSRAMQRIAAERGCD
jgi:AcrR family transcriptional regulator